MNKYVFINGIILDGSEEMKPIYNKYIFINNGKIEKISNDKVNIDGYEIINLNNSFIMPGLINLHVHLPASGMPKKKSTDPKKLVKLITSNSLLRKLGKKICLNYAKIELMSGTTTIRTVGGILDFDSKIRDDILKGKAIGPRILASNMAISTVGGHMAGSLAYEANNKEDVIQYVEKIAKEKPDLIKLMITGGVLDAVVKGEPGVLKMKPDLVKAACSKAHELGYVVAAHVESSEGVKIALENGVDTIEHGAKVNDEIIKLFKEKKASHITTICPALPYALFDKSISGASDMSQYNGKVVFDGIIDCAKSCLENNIPVGLGTDVGCNYVTHYNMWMELQLFHKYCNVSNKFALYSATLGNARIAKIDNITGAIKEGLDADLIVTKDNPLNDLSVLKNIDLVMARGELFNQPRVKKNKQVEVEMSKYL